MMKRLIIAGVVLAFVGAACGDDTADTVITTVTTASPSTTVAAGTTTTGPTSTTTTVAAGLADPSMGIVLDDGIGAADTQQSAMYVIETVTELLGPPVLDTGDSTDTGCPGIHRSVAFLVPAPPDGIESRLVLHFTDGDDKFPWPVFTDWAYWGENTDGAPEGAKALLSTPEGITIGSTTDEAIDAFPELEFHLNALSGDVMGWTRDFEMIVFADFGPGPFDVTSDFSTMTGRVMALRIPLESCPDELRY